MKQIEKRVAICLAKHENKMRQFMKLKDICVALTSDAGITITSELYNNHICRFVIEGTRCNMVICYDTITWELKRKPRNEKPWDVTEIKSNCYDILMKARSM